MNIELKRAIVFVDHANIFFNLLKRKIRINFELLKIILSEDYHLVGAFMYMGKPNKIPAKKKGFLEYIKRVGYTIQDKPLSRTSGGQTRQKGIDIFIYRDIVELAEEDAYDRCVLVSGDADFVDAVKKVKEFGKEVKLCSFRDSLSKALKKEVGVENIIYLDDFIDDLKI